MTGLAGVNGDRFLIRSSFFYALSAALGVVVGLLTVATGYQTASYIGALAIATLCMLQMRRLRKLAGLVGEDYLTGIGNQRAFWEALGNDVALSRRRDMPLSLVLIDLDGFKQVNDRYGHRVGDLLLKGVADSVRATCRGSDRVFRYGGDEFAIICQDTTLREAGELCCRVEQSIEELPEGFPRISASFGVAEIGRLESGSELLDAADHALIQVKEDGRPGSISLAVRGDVKADALEGNGEFGAQQTALKTALMALESDESIEAVHPESVERLAVLVAGRLGMRGMELERLRLASKVYDVGSYVIPGSILEKRGPISEEEWELVRSHVEAGERIVRSIPRLEPTAEVVRHTHERWDGGGYPDGLKGHEIPLGSRIISACDCFQALRHERPYRKKLSTNEALAEIKRCAGTQFDPEVANSLVEVVCSGRPGGGNVSLASAASRS